MCRRQRRARHHSRIHEWVSVCVSGMAAIDCVAASRRSAISEGLYHRYNTLCASYCFRVRNTAFTWEGNCRQVSVVDQRLPRFTLFASRKYANHLYIALLQERTYRRRDTGGRSLQPSSFYTSSHEGFESVTEDHRLSTNLACSLGCDITSPSSWICQEHIDV